MYYIPSAFGTIISPDNICSFSNSTFHKFIIEFNIETGCGTMSFISHNTSPFTIATYRCNGIWYFSDHIFYPMTSHQSHTNASILNSHQQYELQSLLMGSPGESTLRMIHKHVNGVSPLKLHTFHMLTTSADANFC